MDNSPAIEIRLFGSLQISRYGQPVTDFTSRKAEALFIYLALDRRPHPREVLADLLWDDRTQKQALGNLRVLLSNLRQLFPDEINASRKTIGIRPEVAMWMDTAVLAQALRRDGGPLTAETAAALAAALDFAVGPFLSGFYLRDALRFEEWITLERERWQQQLLTGLDQLTHYYVTQNQLDRAAVYAQKLVRTDPLREQSQQLYMRILARRSEANLALAQYRDFVNLLDEELGVPPAPETKRLYQRIRQAKISPGFTLPQPVSPLIGRLSELAQLDQRLDEDGCRLLTIVGIGGIGKTRLAQALAWRRAHEYLNGVCFVSVAAADSELSFLLLLAQGLGITLEGQVTPASQILDFLRQREMLLILDNMEHLIDHTVDFIRQILHNAPDVQLVVTSRERLLLRQEWVFQLAGLPVDGQENGAFTLLVERMKQFAPDLVLTPEVETAVRMICRLVDGVPLALELAAAVCAFHPPSEVAEEIAADLDFLRTQMRDLPDRHRSIRAVFTRSWKLLTEEEKQVFSALSVFKGTFSAEAAEAVSGGQRFVLESLQTQSLLQHTADGYSLHELLRQYAAEQLSGDGERLAAVYEAHSRYYSGQLDQQHLQMRGQTMSAALEGIAYAYDNIQVVWQRALTEGNEEIIQQMVSGLANYHYVLGQFQPALANFTVPKQALSGRIKPDVLAELLAWQTLFLSEVGESERAIALAAEALETLTTDAPTPARAISLCCQGYAYWSQGGYEEARELLAQAAEIATEVGLVWVEAQCLNITGNLLLDQGETPEAQEKYTQALALTRSTQEPRLEASVRINLGNVHWHVGDYAQARDEFEQAFTLCEQFGMRQLESLALNNIGLVDSEQGLFDRGLEVISQALAISREVGDRRGEGNALLNLVAVQMEVGHLTDAWESVDDALLLCHAIGDRQGEAIALEHHGNLYLRCGAYAQAADYFTQAWEIYQELGEAWGLATVSVWRGLLALYTQPQTGTSFDGALSETSHALERAQELQDHNTEAIAQMVRGHIFYAQGQYAQAAEAYVETALLREDIGQLHLLVEFQPAWLFCEQQLGQAHSAAEIEALLEAVVAGAFPGIYEPGRIYADTVRLLDALEDPRAEEVRQQGVAYIQQAAAQLRPSQQATFLAIQHHQELLNGSTPAQQR